MYSGYVRRPFNSICTKILELPADKARLQYTFSATAVEVTPNAQGRVIPQNPREFAGIEATHFNRNEQSIETGANQFDEFMASQKDTISEALSMLRL